MRLESPPPIFGGLDTIYESLHEDDEQNARSDKAKQAFVASVMIDDSA